MPIAFAVEHKSYKIPTWFVKNLRSTSCDVQCVGCAVNSTNTDLEIPAAYIYWTINPVATYLWSSKSSAKAILWILQKFPQTSAYKKSQNVVFIY